MIARPLPRGLLAASILCALQLAAHPAHAEDLDAAAADKQATSLDAVVVLGTKRADVTALSSATPVDVVTIEQIRRTGATNLSQALQTLIPSFHFPQGSRSNVAGAAIRGVSLRGLGVDQTLVLVNGQRRHTSAALSFGSGDTVNNGTTSVDLTAIPMSAVARVEVLRDGAATKYGSDAIGGVVNIILKQDDRGGEVSTRIGQYSSGQGLTKSVEGSLGTKLPGQDGFLTVAFDAWDSQKVAMNDPDKAQRYFAGDPREATTDRNNWFSGISPSSRYNVSVNAGTGLTDQLSAYATAIYGEKKDGGPQSYREANNDGVLRAFYPDGMQPYAVHRSTNLSVSAGLRYQDEQLGDFDFDLTHGKSRVSSRLHDSDNASLGLASPTDFYAGRLSNTQDSVTLDWSRGFNFARWPGTVTASAGASYRHEEYTIGAGDWASYGDGGQSIIDGPNAGNAAPIGAQGLPGWTPEDAGAVTRSVRSLHAGLENQITDKLLLDLSVRGEDYSDFGSTGDGQLSARYDFTPAFALRGTYGTGYRAPALGQMVYSRTQYSYLSGQIVSSRTIPVDSAAARALGARDLKPEESDSLSLGAVWRPSTDSSVTLDAYQIKVDDRIVLSERLSGSIVRAALIAAGYPDITTANYFLNGPDTRTRGVDLVGKHRFSFDGGSLLDLTAGFNYSQTDITKLPTNPAQLQNAGITLYGRLQQGLLTDGNPDTTFRLSSDYRFDRWSVSGSVVRYGKYKLFNSTSASLDQTFSPQWIANTQVSYDFDNGLRLGVGADNLFDSHPDRTIEAARNIPVARYSSLAPEGAAGAFYYLSLGYAF